MDLVSNFVGSISPNMFSGNTQSITQNYDLEDTTFSDMLEKQINKEFEQIKPNFVESLGLPTGFNIADFDGTIPQFKYGMNNTENNENKLDTVKPEFENSMSNSDKDNISTSELLTFFNSLFDSKPTLTDTSNSELFQFERKTAANLYSKYAKNVVLDLGEFVADTLKHS